MWSGCPSKPKSFIASSSESGSERGGYPRAASSAQLSSGATNHACIRISPSWSRPIVSQAGKLLSSAWGPSGTLAAVASIPPAPGSEVCQPGAGRKDGRAADVFVVGGVLDGEVVVVVVVVAVPDGDVAVVVVAHGGGVVAGGGV